MHLSAVEKVEAWRRKRRSLRNLWYSEYFFNKWIPRLAMRFSISACVSSGHRPMTRDQKSTLTSGTVFSRSATSSQICKLLGVMATQY